MKGRIITWGEVRQGNLVPIKDALVVVDKAEHDSNGDTYITFKDHNDRDRMRRFCSAHLIAVRDELG